MDNKQPSKQTAPRAVDKTFVGKGVDGLKPVTGRVAAGSIEDTKAEFQDGMSGVGTSRSI